LRRNCLLEYVTGGTIKELRILRRRRTQLKDNLKEKRIYRNLKEQAFDSILWRTRLGRGYGPVTEQTMY
jgi:hypothetical protein